MNLASLYFMSGPVMMLLGNTGFLALYLFAGVASSGISLLFSRFNRQPFYQSHGASVSARTRRTIDRRLIQRRAAGGYLRHNRLFRRSIPANHLFAVLHRSCASVAMCWRHCRIRLVFGFLPTRWDYGQCWTRRWSCCWNLLVHAQVRSTLKQDLGSERYDR